MFHSRVKEEGLAQTSDVISVERVSGQSTAILGAMMSDVTTTFVKIVQRYRLRLYQRTKSDVQVVTHCISKQLQSRGRGPEGNAFVVTSVEKVSSASKATTDVIIRATTTSVMRADPLVGQSTT